MICRPAACVSAPLDERSCRAFCGARGAEMAAVKAVEGAFGREEAKTALFANDDTRGSIRYFDDIGLRHVCSIAGLGAPV